MKLKMIMILSSAMLATSMSAHDGVGPHGGRLADTSTHHLELVVKNDTVDVFVSDKASTPVPATGSTGLAIVIAGGKSMRIALTGEDAKLSGKTPASLPDGVRSVVQVKLMDGQTIQARFD